MAQGDKVWEVTRTVPIGGGDIARGTVRTAYAPNPRLLCVGQLHGAFALFRPHAEERAEAMAKRKGWPISTVRLNEALERMNVLEELK